MKKITLLFLLLICTSFGWSQTSNTPASPQALGKIITYFNRPVNNAVSTGTNAIYLHDLIDDTLIAYINRAKLTLDIAVYSFNESGSLSSISSAINAAYARGVAIRWIYNGGTTANPSVALLNSNIKTLASPTGAYYGLMHNKFMIIDANSANASEPTVWTGSTNWTTTQINTDANNVVIIQDKPVAQAYTTEFNEMWGGTGLSPNLTNSKFGSSKTNNTAHNFAVGGVPIEIYFSPTDGTNSKLQQSISSANIDMYFGIYSFTDSIDASLIADRIQHNVYVAGIIDPTSNSYPPYAILKPIMGANIIKDTIPGTGLYHNKMLIVDPSAAASDPLVFTGSHNWSASAETKNDENTVIIHNATIANIYYQSFHQNFTDVGGTLIPQSGIESLSKSSSITVYPNPCNEFATIKTNIPLVSNNPELAIFDLVGKEIHTSISKNNSQFIINTKQLSEGLYLVQIKTPDAMEIIKLQVIH